jgi:DNA polymerase-3 subunit gamma/tau
LYLAKAPQIGQGEAIRAIRTLGNAMERMTRGNDQRIELELALFSLTEPVMQPVVTAVPTQAANTAPSVQPFAAAPTVKPFASTSTAAPTPFAAAPVPVQPEPIVTQPIPVTPEMPVKQSESVSVPPIEPERAPLPIQPAEEAPALPTEETAPSEDIVRSEVPPPWEDVPPPPLQEQVPPAPISVEEAPPSVPEQRTNEYPADPTLRKKRSVAQEGVNPYPQWAEVIKKLQDVDPMLYGYLKRSKAYFDGTRVLIAGGNTFRDFIRVNKASQQLIKKLIAEVSGVAVPIGPYEPKTAQAAKPTTDAEQNLQALEKLGVEVVIRDSEKPTRKK